MSIVRDLPGIRVVRPLGRDPHRERWLVQLAGEQPTPAVLARACGAQGARLLRVEAVALHRGRGPGVVSLIDVVDDPGGAAVLRAHCVGPVLSAVLAERERWDAGEVVTAFRPVIQAIDRLHLAGVAHGGLSAAEIVVAESGGVLVDLGHAELFEPGSPEAVLVRLDAVGRDRDAVRALATDLLRRVVGSRARAAHSLADAVEQLDSAQLVRVLLDGLDDLAAPMPLALRDPQPPTPPVSAPQAARLMPVVRAAGDEQPIETRAADWRAAAATKLASVRARADALPAGRRRMLVAGGAAVTAAAVLLALPTAGEAEGPRSPLVPGAPGTASAGPVDDDAAHDGAAHDGPARGEATELSDPDSSAAGAAIAGDDPLAATIALLGRRSACFGELSLLCLEGVNQQGSSASSADRAAMQTLRDGQEARYASAEAVDPRLIERLGNSALVEVGPETAPASLLLMRSEAGWRIRDWIAGEGVD